MVDFDTRDEPKQSTVPTIPPSLVPTAEPEETVSPTLAEMIVSNRIWLIQWQSNKTSH